MDLQSGIIICRTGTALQIKGLTQAGCHPARLEASLIPSSSMYRKTDKRARILQNGYKRLIGRTGGFNLSPNYQWLQLNIHHIVSSSQGSEQKNG